MDGYWRCGEEKEKKRTVHNREMQMPNTLVLCFDQECFFFHFFFSANEAHILNQIDFVLQSE